MAKINESLVEDLALVAVLQRSERKNSLEQRSEGLSLPLKRKRKYLIQIFKRHNSAI